MQLVGPLADHGAGEPEVPAVDEQVLAHGQLEVERVLLRDRAEAGPDLGTVGRRVHAEHPQLAAGHRRDARDHPHRRGLARAVRPEEAERLARLDPEVDAVDRDEVAEALGQARAPRSSGCVVTRSTLPTVRTLRVCPSRHPTGSARAVGHGLASGPYGEADVRGVGRRRCRTPGTSCATASWRDRAEPVRGGRPGADRRRARHRGRAGAAADADARGRRRRSPRWSRSGSTRTTGARRSSARSRGSAAASRATSSSSPSTTTTAPRSRRGRATGPTASGRPACSPSR